MGNDFLDSSDAVRSARPLTYAQTVTFDEPLPLELGGELPNVTVCYETYGKLSPAGDNAVLICHAISGDSHVAAHDENDDPGWWDIAGVVGPGKYIDTDKYFVICPNILGGCRGTTGPNSVNPATGKPYGRDFPTITIGDMVEAQKRLLDHLGIEQLLAAVGGSMGGHQVLWWATHHPDRLRGAVAVATAPRLSSQALAFDVVGRNAILHDPNFHDGQYYDGPPPTAGLAIARMIGHITYLSPEAMQQKFDLDRLQPRDVPGEFEKKFSVGSYLGHQGTKFVERFDANSYMTISMAMDLFDLGETREELTAALSKSRCRWLVLSFTSDWLFPPSQSRDLVDALVACDKDVSYANIASHCGHDAFFLPDDVETYGTLTRAFLANVAGQVSAPAPGSEDSAATAPTSIFHSRRLDYRRLAELIEPDNSVLDLGCGNGALLRRLKRRGHKRLLGVERDERAVVLCVRRGLDVIQADLNDPLPFADEQFDTVVLSRTLQAVYDVETVMSEMLRVGRKCIVSFPNFAYHKLAAMLAEQGRAPETSGVLKYRWYDSPNIRFFSIRDFEDFCAEKGITVHRRLALDTEADAEVMDDPNRNADLAIFVVSR